MVQGMQYRRTSRLKALVDEIDWWDTQGQLFALGHSLCALMDDLDRYKNSGKHSIAESGMYLKRCTALNEEFEGWHEDLLDCSPCPTHWTPHWNDPEKKEHLEFANLRSMLYHSLE